MKTNIKLTKIEEGGKDLFLPKCVFHKNIGLNLDIGRNEEKKPIAKNVKSDT